MSERQFDIKRDNELINAGTHFWCHACMVARLWAEKSPDERYCFRCFAVLMDEAALLPKRKAWMPRGAVLAHDGAQKEGVTTKELVECATPRPVTNSNRGLDSAINARIAVLAGAGKKPRDISAALSQEGINISYRTVYRRLQGALI